MADRDGSETWALIAVLGISLLLVGSLLIFLLSYLIDQLLPTTGTFGPATEVVSIALNGFLTLALILIYRDIRSAESEQEKWMEKQTEILNEQQNLSEAQLTPLLSVAFSEDDIDGDELTLSCSNTGTGIARELDIELELFVSDANPGGSIYSLEGRELTPLSNLDESIDVEIHGGQMDGRTVPGSRGYWGSAGPLRYANQGDGQRTRTEPVVKSDDEVPFTCILRVMQYGGPAADPSDANPTSFESATERLVEDGYSIIGFRLRLFYEDLIGKRQESTLLGSGYTELDAGMSFHDIFANSVGEVGRIDAPQRYGGQRDIAFTRP